MAGRKTLPLYKVVLPQMTIIYAVVWVFSALVGGGELYPIFSRSNKQLVGRNADFFD